MESASRPPAWRAWLARPGNAALAAAVGVNLVLILWTAVHTLRRFPNAGDEYAYLLSAELFSRGKLSVPSPEPRHFFDFHHVLNDGKFYGKYPPGWPSLLMFGVLAGLPWLVNPVLAVANLFLLHALARRHFSPPAAAYASLALLANAFFVFNSASHFAHASCMFFVTLAFWGFLNWREDPTSRRDALLAGLGAGMAFLIRPFTAVLLLAPAGFAMLALAVRRRAWGGLALAAAPLAAACALFLLYNHLLTGDPFLQPFTKYNPSDRPSLPTSPAAFAATFVKFSVVRALELAWPWLPLCWLLALAVLVHPVTRRDPKAWLLAASVALLFLGYGFYPADGGIGYGPRYCYEAIAPVAVLMGIACARFPRLGPNLAAVVLAVNLVLFANFTGPVAEEIRGKTELFESVRRAGLRNAIVFLETGSGSGHPGDLARNGITFDGDVLYVRDFGVGNRELLDLHPGRKAYVYRWDETSKRGSLTPWAP
jgi:hypothetical protein